MITEAFSLPMSGILFVGDEAKDRRTAEIASCLYAWIHRQQGQLPSSVLAPSYEHHFALIFPLPHVILGTEAATG